MKPYTQQHPLEVKIPQVIRGYRSLEGESITFTFQKERFGPQQVAAELQKGLDLFEEVKRTRAMHEAAVEACKRGIPTLQLLFEEAKVVARRHFGSDPERMARFGLTPGKARTPRRRGGTPKVSEEVVVIDVETTTCGRSQRTSKAKGGRR